MDPEQETEQSPEEEEPEDNEPPVYSYEIKNVLRTYQATANTSLHGPNSVIGLLRTHPTQSVSSAESRSSMVNTTTLRTLPNNADDDEPYTAPPPFPIQQPPIFTPPDQSRCEKTTTILQNETISCFTVGGEKRLCLPQILNTVLRDFTLTQINSVCDNLHIFCSRCTLRQLEVLKATSVLPNSAPSCGLITKTDAERLCSALLDSNPPRLMRNQHLKALFQVRVYHECFGKCAGLYIPDLYQEPSASCIECTECRGVFSPQKFVCHSHFPTENRTCHWGFDSFNWRAYLMLHKDAKDDVQMNEAFKDMKSRYEFVSDFNHKYKRKQVYTDSRDPSKKVRVENFYPYPYALDPSLVCWYPSPWSKVTALKPLPSVITSNERPLLVHPEALPYFCRERSPYFLNESSLLQPSDHVLPLAQSERFENQCHASVAYGPSAVRKLRLKEINEVVQLYNPRYKPKAAETLSRKCHLKKEPNSTSSSCCMETEDVFSDTSSSTLSAGTDDSLFFACEDDDICTVEKELQPITALLNESGVDSTICTKVLAEVQGLVSKYQKCLKASIQSKKLMQTEFEKLHSKQREKIRKLRVMGKYLEKNLVKQGEVLQPESDKATTTSTASDTVQLTVETDSIVPEEDTDVVATQFPNETTSEEIADDSDSHNSMQSHKSPEVKAEMMD